MKIFYDSRTETAPQVIDGEPPADQSAVVTQLQTENSSLKDHIAVLEGALTNVKSRAQARKDADNAKIEGQDDLDEISKVGL